MTRFILVALLILSILLTCGCQSNPAAPESTSGTKPTVATTEATTNTQLETESLQLPMYAISLPQTKKNTTTDDGHIVYRYVSQMISLILPEAEVADRIILDFLTQQDTIDEYAQSASQAALNTYSGTNEDPHLLQMLYSPMRFDAGILSLYGDKVSYTGGAHSVSSGQSLNYDLLTGNRLTLNDVLNDTLSKEALVKKVTDALSRTAAQKQLFPTYGEMISYLIPSDLSVCTNWYFSDEGLNLYFVPGEIAPYASGSIVAVIPYQELTGLLLDSFFPTEKIPEEGTVSAQIFDTDNLTDFTHFSELILEKGTQKILLHTNATVYDIKITETISSTGTISQDRDPVLYAAYALSKNDAIMIEADFNTTLLRLEYRTKNGVQQYTLAADAESVTLNKD